MISTLPVAVQPPPLLGLVGRFATGGVDAGAPGALVSSQMQHGAADAARGTKMTTTETMTNDRNRWEQMAKEYQAQRNAMMFATSALIREIQKRDGEGNTVPAHTYSRLANLIRAAGGQV